MSLKAILTVGWKDGTANQLSAKELHDEAEKEAGKLNEAEQRKCYEDTLLHQIKDANTIIVSTTGLFRRNKKGFGGIKKFVSSLMSVDSENDIGNIYCLMDVFSYAFLKGAKNLDFQLPEIKKDFPKEVDKILKSLNLDLFRKFEKEWRENIIPTLEEFERMGKSFPENFEINNDDYLDLRGILTRTSARDERRSLATLLVSGPSTMEEISEDLGLNYTLGNRILGVFADIGVVETQGNDKYVISLNKLPLVIFFLREIMGLDLLRLVKEEIKK